MKQRFNKCFDTLFDMGVEHTQYVRDDIQVKNYPFYDIATDIGNAKGANMVALGALMKFLPFLSKEAAIDEVKKAFSAKQQFIESNLKAFEAGYNYEG